MEKRAKFPWLYLALAYTLAWVFWIPVALTRRDYQSSPLLLALMLIGVFGPGIAGIALSYVEGGKAGGRAFWRRVVDVRRVRPQWWLTIFLLWPVLHLAAMALNRLLGGEPHDWAFAREMASQPLNLLVVPVLYFLQAGLEELGWRGYMLDKLQARYRPLVAWPVLGICHALWHLPTFLIAGTNQIKYGFGLDLWIFIGVVIAGSVYESWCYNANGRSTFAAIAFHFTYNLAVDLFSSPGMQQRIFHGLAMLGALIVALSWRKRQTRQAGPRERSRPLYGSGSSAGPVLGPSRTQRRRHV